jgi:hypothetical protein
MKTRKIQKNGHSIARQSADSILMKSIMVSEVDDFEKINEIVKILSLIDKSQVHALPSLI